MLVHVADEYLLVFPDFAGDGGEHLFLVLPEEGGDLFLDFQLAEVAEEEVLAIVHLVLAGEHLLLDFLDLLADHLVGEVGERPAGQFVLVGVVDAEEGVDQLDPALDGLVDLLAAGLQLLHLLVVGVDGVDVLLEVGVLASGPE